VVVSQAAAGEQAALPAGAFNANRHAASVTSLDASRSSAPPDRCQQGFRAIVPNAALRRSF